jgi:hypothetical protein
MAVDGREVDRIVSWEVRAKTTGKGAGGRRPTHCKL